MEYGIGIRTNNLKEMKETLNDIGDMMECLSDREFVLDHLCIGLQKVSNDSLIKRPTQFSGIESYLYIHVGDNGEWFKTARVGKSVMEELNIELDEAWSRAEQNTFSDIRVESIFSMMGMDDLEMDELYVPMLVVTNTRGFRGASSILDNNTIRKVARRFDSRKLVMFPSSIHECILVPYEESMTMDELNFMVKSINNSEVEPEDVLSDRAYIVQI